MMSRQCPCSVASCLRKFLRTGSESKMRLTAMEVPSGQPTASFSRMRPLSTAIRVPATSPRRRVDISTRQTAAMLGSASPRKPKDFTS